MDEKKKLSVVIEHWVEHNQSHMGEYQRWAQKAGELELELVKAQIEEAIGKLAQCNHCLAKALERL